jgi:hypothetical protein
MVTIHEPTVTGFAVTEFLNKDMSKYHNAINIYEIEINDEFFQNVIELIYGYKLNDEKTHLIFFDNVTEEIVKEYNLEDIRV